MLTENGQVYGRGRNNYAQLASSATFFVELPRHIPELEAVVKIACGSHHALAITRDQQVYVWGRTYDGRLGISSSRECITTPTLLPSQNNVKEALGAPTGFVLSKQRFTGKRQPLHLSNQQDELGSYLRNKCPLHDVVITCFE